MINEQFPILPDEHLYSWLARLYLLSGHASTTSFFERFNITARYFKAQAIFEPAIAKILAMLSHVQDKRLLLHQHSEAPLWQMSLRNVQYEALSNALSDGSLTETQHMNEQMLFGFDKSWHACRVCMDEDSVIYGVPYWHASHQLPSITCCKKHKCMLLRSEEPLKNLISLVLPHQIQNWQAVIIGHNSDIDAWEVFLHHVFDWVCTNPSRVLELQQQLTATLGLDGKNGLKRKEWCNQVYQAYEDRLGHELLKHLFRTYSVPRKEITPNILTSFLAPLTERRGIRNPIYWLSVAYWLRDDLPVLAGVERYDQVTLLSTV